MTDVHESVDETGILYVAVRIVMSTEMIKSGRRGWAKGYAKYLS